MLLTETDENSTQWRHLKPVKQLMSVFESCNCLQMKEATPAPRTREKLALRMYIGER